MRGARSRVMSASPYVELHCHSNFSFLDGGSHPYELAMRAAELELPALALSATDDENRLRALQEALGRDVVFSELHHHMSPEDAWILEGRAAMARRCGSHVVATNEVHYHVRERRRMHDALVAIRHRMTLDEARPHLFPNAEHCLKSGDELRQIFKDHAEALATPWEIAQECDIDLDSRKVRF